MLRYASLFRRPALSFFAAVFGASGLIFAYTAEHLFGLLPCILCIYQRIPFLTGMIFGGISFIASRRSALSCLFLLLAALSYLTGAGIAAFHVGVEQGLFTMTEKCEDFSSLSYDNFEDFAASLMGKPHVPCDKPQFVFLSLSMAAWNALISSLFGCALLILLYIDVKKYKATS